MRIGILTVHSQINYGAVLQTYALQTILSEMGHDVVVLNRKVDATADPLLGPLEIKSFQCWSRLLLRGLVGLGDYADLHRRIRTRRFIREILHLSNYEFTDWSDAPYDLGVDVIVVGSDQIWNTTPHDPHMFLLDTQMDIPAITYAASFGTDSLDAKWEPLFKRQLPHFRCLSVRERQGQRILQDLGFSSSKVLDPTVLVRRSAWEKFIRPPQTKRKRLVCYFSTMPSWQDMLSIYQFSDENNCLVELFLGRIPLEMPKHLDGWRSVFCEPFYSARHKVHNMFCATPDVFVSAVANAEWVVTSTFHGLMFASIFGKQVRLVNSFHKNHQGLKRMEEYIEDFMSGEVEVQTIGEALLSLKVGQVKYEVDKIRAARTMSKEWLENALILCQ